MSQTLIRIQLQADASQAQGAINSFASQIENRLGGALRSAGVQANLLTSGIEASVRAIGSMFNGLSAGFSQASDIQLQNINLSGNLMKLLGVNYSQATDFVDQFSNSMSKVAAALPGATSDYVDMGRAIADDLVPALKDINGAVDIESFQKRLQAVATSGTLLAQASGVSTTQAATALSKYLSGTASKAELAQLDFFQKNTTFRNALFAEFEAQGLDLKKASDAQRLAIYEKVSKVDPRILEAQKKSVSGLISNFMANLFDPKTGLFGFMRDVNQKIKGEQTAFNAIGEVINSLVGDNGLFGYLNKTLKAFGIDFGDPMAGIRDFSLALKTKIDYLRNSLNTFLNFDLGMNYGADTGKFRSQVLGKLGNDIQFLLSSIFKVDGAGINLGKMFNDGMDFIKNINWAAIGSYIGSGLAKIVNEGFLFINNINWDKVIEATLQIGKGLLVGLGTFLSQLNWPEVGKGLLVIFGVATAAAGGIILASTIGGLGLLGTAIGVGFVSLAGIMTSQWDNLKLGAELYWQDIIKASTSFGSYMSSLWTGLTDEVGRVWLDVTNSVKSFFKKIQEFFTNFNPFPQLGNGGQSGLNFSPSMPTNFANGNPGMLEALLRESKAMPIGARPVIANSSEAILNQSQQRSLLANSGGISFNPVFNIQAIAQDGEQIGKMALDYIERELEKYQMNHI